MKINKELIELIELLLEQSDVDDVYILYKDLGQENVCEYIESTYMVEG